MIDYAAWSKDPAAVRVVLIEVDYLEGGSVQKTRFLSTKAYTTSPTDSPANQYYEPIVKTGLKFTEQLSLEGDGGLSGGDIEIQNATGERDSWLNDIWDNQSVRAYIGDVRWARTEFEMIFNGVVSSFGSKSMDTLNIILKDKLQRLNTPVTDQKIGVGQNADEIYSLTFGEASNVTPNITNAAELEYEIHNGAVEDIFDVRDNGKKVSFAEYLATGKFRLIRSPAGTITCSVQGDKGGNIYRNTIAALVERIVTGFGQADSRFTTGDIDTANFASFASNFTQPVGAYADGRTNVLSLCRNLASSVGAQLVMSRTGKLRLIQLTAPTNGVAVGENQMIVKSLKIKERPFVKAAVMLGFNKNWTVQENLLTTIPEEHKKLYATEWLTATAASTQVQSTYKLNAAPVQVDTMLLRRTDAQAEAQRRLNLWSVPRTIFEFEATNELLGQLELGTAITLTHKRFGLEAGKPGTVVSLTHDWLTGRMVVGVLV